MAGRPKRRRKLARIAANAAREAARASGPQPEASPFCPYCGDPLAPNKPTCGAESCRADLRRTRDAFNRRVQREVRKAAGLCLVCGRKPHDQISQTTPGKIARCKRCHIRHLASMRRVRKRKLAEKAKTAAIVRLAAASIERRRIQQQRLDHGLPYSLSTTPILPKDTPRQQVEL